MLLATMGVSLGCWYYLLSKAQQNRHKGRICKVPHSKRGCGGDGGDEQPSIQQIPMTSQQNQLNALFSDIQVPWMKNQYQTYQDVYQPMSKELGGILGEELKNPLTLPEDVWTNLYQKGKTNIAQGYNEQRQTGSERLAGKNLLTSPISERYFQNLDLSQAKSIENYAVDMAISQFQEKVAAKNQAIQNSMSFLSGQPSFQITPQVPQYYTQAAQQGQDYSGLGGALGIGAGLAASAMLPGSQIAYLPALMGMTGQGLGSLF